MDAPAGAKLFQSTTVSAGDVIGTAADLQNLKNAGTGQNYPATVTPHIHVQVYDNNNQLIDPTPFFTP